MEHDRKLKLPDSPTGNEQWLTAREMAVLRLVASGLHSKDIAGLLFVGKKTIDWHLAQIYRKLSVHNRIQALNEARTLGLLDVFAKSTEGVSPDDCRRHGP